VGSDLDDSFKTVESRANLRVVQASLQHSIGHLSCVPRRSGARAMGKLTTKKEIMPLLPVVFGLGELEAAAAIGISTSKFRLLVSQKRMPSPRRLDGRKIWDVDELREAFKALPHQDEDKDEEVDSWADLA
jgi:hypothetical protein